MRTPAGATRCWAFDEGRRHTRLLLLPLGDELMTGLPGPFEGRFTASRLRDSAKCPRTPPCFAPVDWYVRLCVLQQRAIARLYDVSPVVT